MTLFEKTCFSTGFGVLALLIIAVILGIVYLFVWSIVRLIVYIYHRRKHKEDSKNCFNCEHIQARSALGDDDFPCCNCSRNPGCKDRWERWRGLSDD